MMYNGNGQAPTSLHVPNVTCHMIWLAWSYGSEGTQMGSPSSGCIRTVLALQFPMSQPGFFTWKLNKR